MENISHLIQQVANDKGSIQTYAAKVIAINEEVDSKHIPEEDAANYVEAYTVNVLRSDGAEIRNVRLKASLQDKEQGVVCVPKINSWVFISIIETTETRAFVSQFSEIDKIFLRIKNNASEGEDTKFFEVHTDVEETKLLFKKQVGEGDAASMENITSINYSGEERSLNITFWDEEKDQIVHETTIAHDKVNTFFKKDDKDTTSCLLYTSPSPRDA